MSLESPQLTPRGILLIECLAHAGNAHRWPFGKARERRTLHPRRCRRAHRHRAKPYALVESTAAYRVNSRPQRQRCDSVALVVSTLSNGCHTVGNHHLAPHLAAERESIFSDILQRLRQNHCVRQSVGSAESVVRNACHLFAYSNLRQPATVAEDSSRQRTPHKHAASCLEDYRRQLRTTVECRKPHTGNILSDNHRISYTHTTVKGIGTDSGDRRRDGYHTYLRTSRERTLTDGSHGIRLSLMTHRRRDHQHTRYFLMSFIVVRTVVAGRHHGHLEALGIGNLEEERVATAQAHSKILRLHRESN